MKRDATLANLLSETLEQVQEHARLIGVYLAILVPVSTVAGVFGADPSGPFNFGFGFQLTSDLFSQGLVALAFGLIAFVLSIALTYWLYAGMVRGTMAMDFDRFWPYLGIYILSSIAIAFGLLLVLVPGIILAVRWCPILPLVVRGQTPAMDTFGESWKMTSGAGWSIFGAIIVLGIAMIVVSGVIVGGSVFGGSNSLIASAMEALAEHGSTAVFAAFAVGAYRLLQDDEDELTEIFE